MPAGVVMNNFLNASPKRHVVAPKTRKPIKHPFCNATSARYISARKGYMLQVNSERKKEHKFHNDNAG